MSHIVLLSVGWREAPTPLNAGGLLKLVGLSKFYRERSQPTLSPLLEFLPKPLCDSQVTIWGAFLSSVYPLCSLDKFKGVPPPVEVLEALVAVVAQDLFPEVQVMMNDTHFENMIAGITGEQKVVPVARWTCVGRQLLTEDEVIPLVEEGVTNKRTGPAISKDLRLKTLEACWSRTAELAMECYSFRPWPRLSA